jgi:murein DD-endopeptidase MepM/ murein hydrolase activator NlpD
MHLIFVLFFLAARSSPSNGDALLLPIQRGIIIKDSNRSMMHHPMGILIAPTNDFEVRSCTNGKINAVIKLQDNKSLIVVASDKNTYYSYGLVDEVAVEKGQTISKGSVLGKLKNSPGELNVLAFSVSRDSKDLNAEKYTVYQK